MRVVVTGGAGFIGSRLCERLIDAGHDVTCLDNLMTGTRANLAALAGAPRFHFQEHDVVRPLPVSGPVDWIFNLACPASPVAYQSNPVKTIQTNVLGTVHAVELARRTGARILQASTSEVYGDPTVHPQPEEYWGNVNPVGPRACYDEGKRVAETLLMDYHRQLGLDIRIARIFNTYGPRMALDDGRVVSNFIVQALRGQPLTLYGEGTQTRSFCFVDDLVEGLLRLMAADRPGDELHLPVNLGNPGEFTIAELAALVAELCGSPGRVVYRPLPKDDPLQRQPDISRARRLLDWAPAVPLRAGLERTIPDFRARVALRTEAPRRGRRPSGRAAALAHDAER